MYRFSLPALSYFLLSLPGKADTLLRIVPAKQTAWISWISDDDEKRSNAEEWAVFCENLGKQLLTTPGPGFLSSYVCQQKGHNPPSPLPHWHIQMTEHKNSLEFKLSFQLTETSEEVRSWIFPTQGLVMKNLDGEVLPNMIARMLVEESPTGRAYKYFGEPPTLGTQNEILPLPPDLFVYDLFYEEQGIWQPRIRARISKIKGKDGEDGEKAEYALDQSYKPLEKGRTYWVRSLDSKERHIKYQKTITDILQGKQNSLLPKETEKKSTAKKIMDDFFLGSFRSSYAGFRYGKSIAPSDSIVAKVDMLSILAEIGGGPLSGLRWYYDIFPEVRRGNGNEKEYFSLKRASLGWAFSYEMPSFIRPIVTKMDIQPKIGLLDLKSHFFTVSESGSSGLDFNAKNIYDIALEVGAEKKSAWFRTRLWGAVSTAEFGVSNKSAVKAKSSRGGIDAYFDLFTIKNGNVNLLTFANVEHLSLTKDPKSIDPYGPPTSYAFDANIFFAGMGFTVSW